MVARLQSDILDDQFLKASILSRESIDTFFQSGDGIDAGLIGLDRGGNVGGEVGGSDSNTRHNRACRIGDCAGDRGKGGLSGEGSRKAKNQQQCTSQECPFSN